MSNKQTDEYFESVQAAEQDVLDLQQALLNDRQALQDALNWVEKSEKNLAQAKITLQKIRAKRDA